MPATAVIYAPVGGMAPSYGDQPEYVAGIGRGHGPLLRGLWRGRAMPAL